MHKLSFQLVGSPFDIEPEEVLDRVARMVDTVDQELVFSDDATVVVSFEIRIEEPNAQGKADPGKSR